MGSHSLRFIGYFNLLVKSEEIKKRYCLFLIWHLHVMEYLLAVSIPCAVDKGPVVSEPTVYSRFNGVLAK